MKLIEFLQDKRGALSSKRLCGLSGWLVFIIGTPLFVFYLIRKREFSDAVNMWTSYGFVVLGALGITLPEWFAGKGKIEVEDKKDLKPEVQNT